MKRKEFYSDGKTILSEYSTDKKGKKHGEAVYYYPNGVIHSYGNYYKGNRIGIWVTNDFSGMKKFIERYEEPKGIMYRIEKKIRQWINR